METELNGRSAIRTSDVATDAATTGHRLILVSNRGPLEHYLDDVGRIQRRGSAGGVATALASLPTELPLTWISNATSEADRELAAQRRPVDFGLNKQLRQVAPSSEAFDLFYGTFCNPILWYLQHSLWERLEQTRTEEELLKAWENGYLAVNQTFAEAVVEELDRSSVPARVLIHDYHLYTTPLFIRNLRPNAVLQHFVHIPWPGPDAWQHLPRSIVASICEGLLANNSVVFQTKLFVENFALTCQAFLPDVEPDLAENTIVHQGRRTRLWSNPVSVDICDLRSLLASPVAEASRAKLAAPAGKRTIVRVDRLDAAKNVASGFRAYGRLLEKHPKWVGKVRFLAFLVPSRTNIPEYQAYADEVFAAIHAVNERYGTSAWKPITLFHEQNRAQALVALSLYDVLLVNPVVDGMNLVSKEGPVLNEEDGVLVLSTEAGSYQELRDGALPVSPNDIEQTADALHEALSMPASERQERSRRLRAAIVGHDLSRWLDLLLRDLEEESAAEPIESEPESRLLGSAASGGARAS